MKKRTMSVVFIGLFMMLSVMFMGCSNMLAPSAQAGATGNVTISFSASTGKAALSPKEMDFDLYEFIFTGTGDNTFTEERAPAAGFTFSLNVGAAYTLSVNAYKMIDGNKVLGAQSSAPVSFEVQPLTTVNVRLNGVLSGGGEGTFTYLITYPENTSVVELSLMVTGTYSEELKNDAGVNAISGSKNVAAGWYFLIVRLSMDNGSKVVGYANGVVINPGQTTDFTWKFAKEDFKSVNIGKPAKNWHGFVVDGSSAGYNTGAEGTLYDTFADKTGNDYTNVLKVEPPSAGYDPNTMILSYTIPETGYYKISMSVMAEDWPEKGINIFWQEIDGSWATLAGDYLTKIQGVDAGEWFVVETIVPVLFNENQMIAMLARQSGSTGGNNNSTDNGLNDATIYIRDLKLELNGTAVVNTSLAAGSVCGVTIPAKTLDLFVGQAHTLGYHVYPAGANNKNVSWSSDKESIVTVTQSGQIKAEAQGIAVITVKTADGGFEAKCTVTVTMPVSGVVLEWHELKLPVGGTETLTATIYPLGATNQDLGWTSSDPTVATVDNNGLVTALKKGETTITVSADGGNSDTCVVTVIVPVTGVSLNKATFTLNKGGFETLTATVTPADASNKNVIWSTSTTDVATVSETGLVTAVGGGTATITVTTEDGSKKAYCDVTVTVPVSDVSLNKATLALKKDVTETLYPTVNPSDATNKNVTWESSAPTVATVNNNGLITAVGGGTVTITVTTVDGGKFATCVVTVTVPVTGVSLNEGTMTLVKGTMGNLAATVAPSDASNDAVTWSTSNAAVATVDDGVVMAIGGGTATITVKTADGNFTATCEVTVTVPVTGVGLDKGTMTLVKGTTGNLTATVTPSDATNDAVTWSTSNAAVATVSASGVVTAVNGGTATITVKTADGNFTATCEVTVTVPVTGVSLDKGTMTLIKGTTGNLAATVAPSDATNDAVTWSTSNAAVATVDDGVVMAIGGGTATITVKTADGGFTATCVVTVTVPVTGVGLDKGTMTLVKGTTGNLTATVTPSDATNDAVTWSTSNAAVATVSASGVVTAVNGGTATITVKTADGGFTATCVVTVTIDITFTFDYERPGNILTPSIETCVVKQPQEINISAPAGYAGYQWYIDGKVVSGETGNVFVFDSAGRVTGDYNIGLRITDSLGKIINADTITVTVTR